MSDEQSTNHPTPDPAPHHVRLPGLTIDEEIGLGDVIKRASSLVGIKPCGGCAARAARLNNRVTFSTRR